MRRADNLTTFMCRLSCLNILEPSGPVQPCNGIALPLPLPSIFQFSPPVLQLLLQYIMAMNPFLVCKQVSSYNWIAVVEMFACTVQFYQRRPLERTHRDF